MYLDDSPKKENPDQGDQGFSTFMVYNWYLLFVVSFVQLFNKIRSNI